MNTAFVVIGKNNVAAGFEEIFSDQVSISFPWDSFVSHSWGNIILITRPTYEQMKKFRPDFFRNNRVAILSKDTNFKIEGYYVFEDLSDAARTIVLSQGIGVTLIGPNLCQHLIKIDFLIKIDKIILKVVDHDFEGKVVFPPIDQEKWSALSTSRREAGPRDKYPFTLYSFVRNKEPHDPA